MTSLGVHRLACLEWELLYEREKRQLMEYEGDIIGECQATGGHGKSHPFAFLSSSY